jgi:hypothetical protein
MKFHFMPGDLHRQLLEPGSHLIEQGQKMKVAAITMAEKRVWAHLPQRV